MTPVCACASRAPTRPMAAWGPARLLTLVTGVLQLDTGAGAVGSPVQQRAHRHQQSYHDTDELPLHLGWEMTFMATGQRYFLSHVEKYNMARP